jgi:hypothetical protein
MRCFPLKKTITINVDVDVLEKFNKTVENGQRSETINEFMRNYSIARTTDTIQTEILEQDIEIKKKELLKLSSEIQKNEQQKEIIEQQQQKELKEKLLKEQEVERLKKVCCVCGCVLIPNQKMRVVPNGLICRGCNIGINDELIAKKAGLIK